MSSFAPSSSSNSSVPCRVLGVTRLVLDHGVRGLLLKAIGQVGHDRSISLCLQAMARFFHIIQEKVGKFDVADILSSFSYDEAIDMTNLKNVQITKCPSIGRALVATKLIERGVVVLQDAPYAIVKTFECTCKCHDNIPLPEHVLLALKIALSPDDVLCLTDISDHLNVDSIEASNVQFPWEEIAIVEFLAISAVFTMLCSIPLENQVNFCKKLFYILLKLPLNTHAISRVCTTDGHEDPHIRRSIGVEQKKVAVSLYLLGSAVNHSCRPNSVIRFNDENHLQIVAICDVQEGEEIFISYGPIATLHHTSSRKAILRKQYLFDCLCIECAKGESTNAFFDPLLENVRSKLKIIQMSVRELNSNEKASENIAAVDRLAEELEGLLFLQVDSGAPADVVTLLCECLDVKARFLTELGSFHAAAELVLSTCQMLVHNRIHAKYDVPILREQVKAASLLCNAGDFHKALELAKNVERELSLVVPEADIDLNEARKMHVFLQETITSGLF